MRRPKQAQQQKLLAEAQGQVTATLEKVLQRHPTAAEVLRLQTAKNWMTMVEGDWSNPRLAVG